MVLNLLFNFFKIYQIATNLSNNGDLIFGGTNTFLTLIQNGLYIMSFMSSSIVIVLSFVFRKKIFYMAKKFEEFDLEVQKLNIELNNSRDFGLLLTVFVIKIISFLFTNIVLYVIKQKYVTFVSMLFSSVGIYIPIEIFCGVTYLTLRRVHYVVRASRYFSIFNIQFN